MGIKKYQIEITQSIKIYQSQAGALEIEKTVSYLGFFGNSELLLTSNPAYAANYIDRNEAIEAAKEWQRKHGGTLSVVERATVEQS